MSNFLSGLGYTEGVVEAKDYTAKTVDSGVYTGVIEAAFFGMSNSGARNVTLEVKLENGFKLTETIYITSGAAKGGKNYYESNDVKKYLPGFILIDHLCLLTTDVPLASQEVDERVAKVYKDGTMQNAQVQSLVDLIGKPVKLGVILLKKAKFADGAYTSDVVTINTIDKVFDVESSKTVQEIKEEAEEASYIQTWSEYWEGKTKEDKSLKEAPAGNSSSSSSKASGVSSVFRK